MSDLELSGYLHRFRVPKPLCTPSGACERSFATEAQLEPVSAAGSPSRSPSTSLKIGLLACRRCRRLKRKCDRRLPTCGVCKKAAVPCDLSRPFDSDRMSWLSAFVDSLLPPSINVESVQTGTDLRAIMENVLPTGYSTAPPTVSSVSPPYENTTESYDDTFSMSRWTPGNGFARGHLQPIRDLPEDVTPMQLVDTYFHEYHRVFPIIEKDKFLAEMEPMIRVIGRECVEISLMSLRLYLMMALGLSIYSRKIRSPSRWSKTTLPILYHEVIMLCLENPSEEAIQVLFLLTTYSVFDSTGWEPWTLVAILTRQAIFIDLNRGIESTSSISPNKIEYRYRLFWSVFSIDRHISVAYGLPFTFHDNFEIPLPSITTEEFTLQPVDSFFTLQLTRHSIALRDLESKVLSRFHLEAGDQLSDSRSQSQSLQKFRMQAFNWYTQGCLYIGKDTLHEPIHNTVSWLTVNYQRIMTILYYPSKNKLQTTRSEIIRYQEILQNYTESLYVQFQDRHLPISHITQNRLLVICRMLLYCYSHSESPNLTGLHDALSKSLTMLGVFGPEWNIAVRSRDLFERFASHIKESVARNQDHAASLGYTSNSQKRLLDEIITEAGNLIKQVFSGSSIFNFPTA